MKFEVILCSTENTNDADIEALRHFGMDEFSRTFGHLYDKENLDSYLSEAYSYEQFKAWIDSSAYRIYVAVEMDDRQENDEKEQDCIRNFRNRTILGYSLCGTTTLPFDDVDVNYRPNPGEESNYGEVKRIYIHPRAFGSGVGKSLMDFSMEWLWHTFGRRRIYIGVYCDNIRAQRFYSKLGFVKVGEYGFPVGDHIDREFILACDHSK